MIRESPEMIEIEVEASEARPYGEADRYVDIHQHEPQADVARPERYLWPALMSLWQDR
jgi:hypothetical protein